MSQTLEAPPLSLSYVQYLFGKKSDSDTYGPQGIRWLVALFDPAANPGTVEQEDRAAVDALRAELETVRDAFKETQEYQNYRRLESALSENRNALAEAESAKQRAAAAVHTALSVFGDPARAEAEYADACVKLSVLDNRTGSLGRLAAEARQTATVALRRRVESKLAELRRDAAAERDRLAAELSEFVSARLPAYCAACVRVTTDV